MDVAVLSLNYVLWISVGTILVTTLGYPLFLLALALLVRRHRITGDIEPGVSLVIAAYNEEAVIAAKIENSLTLDYPRHKLQIFVASDGSSDGTDNIAESYRERGVVLKVFPRTGKTGVQNQMARVAAGDILVFSDANAFYRPDAIHKLVRNFADPNVAGVCGQLVYRTEGEGAGTSEQVYWNYEKFVKRRESDLSSVVGANGSIYAVRRKDYVELDEGLISDFVEPLALVRNGKRVVYEPEAISIEDTSRDYGVEYRRKVRILTRAISGLLTMAELMNPFRYGLFSIQLIMHKLMRFLVPVFLFAAAFALVGLAILGSYRRVVLFGVIGLAVAVVVGIKARPEKSSLPVRACQLVYYYVLVNYAVLLAWSNVLRGKRMRLWAPERKQA